MATGVYSWSQTAASNDTADSNINWAEGQLPSTVNNSARAMMAILAKWRDDLSGVQPSNAIQTTGGTANAQTLTTNGSIASLTNGWTVTFKAGATNTTDVTLNVDGLGAKHINVTSGTNCTGGELTAGNVYTVTYHQPIDSWMLRSAGNLGFPSGTIMLFVQTAAPTLWTKITTSTDKMLRVTSGTVSSGGSWTVSGLTVDAHSHTYSGNVGASTSNATKSEGGGASFNLAKDDHGHTYSGTTSGASTNTITSSGAWRPAYIDVIQASKD